MFQVAWKSVRIFYNLMCSLVAHDKTLPAYEDYEISTGDRLISKNATTE